MRGNKTTWFLGFLVVLLTTALALQTAYLIWLHREMYLALNGKSPALADLEKTLAAEVDSLTGLSPEDRTVPQRSSGDSLGLQREVERLMDDPSKNAMVRDLLRDLGIDVAPPTPPAAAFDPKFDFTETPTRYVVTVNLPNIRKSDIDAAVEKGMLKISGKQQDTEFSESFAFPGPVVAGTESITFGDGKLIVSVMKEKPAPHAKGLSS